MDRRVYGVEPSERDPGPKPVHVYVELGPLDGMLFDVTGWPP
ncbi:hypothetical protein [Streptomyces sp. NPDC091259]